jgi:lysophospholipase L1-like esterase
LGRNVFEYHPALGYRFIPQITARVRHESGGYLIRCNGAGFRCDHEATAYKPADRFRILLFGDSYTAGDGVSNGQRYGDLIEAKLDRAEVLNFGLPGSGTDQQFLAFREFCRDMTYDLLLICPLVENIRRNVTDHRITMNSTDGQLVRRPKPYFVLRAGRLELHNAPVPRQVEPVADAYAEVIAASRAGKSAARRLLSTLLQPFFTRHPHARGLVQRFRGICYPAEYEDPSHPSWLLMKAILSAWAAQADAPVVICPLPTPGHIQRYLRTDGYRLRFAELAAEAGAELADAVPAFWDLPPRQRRACMFEHDPHLNQRGHEVLADALLPHVRKYYDRWQPAAV